MNPNHEKHPQVSLIFRHDLPSDRSRYRLVDGSGEEISTANEFLDSLSIRALSERTTRTYAYGLLSFWRWINEEKLEISSLRESDLFRYIRFQNKAAKLKERASPRTVNQRLSVARSLYKWITGKDFPASSLSRHPFTHCHYGAASDVGYLHPVHRQQPVLHVKVPHRVVSALSKEEVTDFLESLRVSGK